MKTFVDLVLRIAELAEAEGRAAKVAAVQVLSAGLIWFAAVCLLIVGFAALLGALYLTLSESLSPAGALTIVSFVPVFVGIIGVFVGRTVLRR